MNKLLTFLKKEYLAKLIKLETVQVNECGYCSARNVESFGHLFKCKNCELNELKKRNKDWYLEQLAVNWPIINYYPKLVNVEFEFHKDKIIVHVIRNGNKITNFIYKVQYLNHEQYSALEWLKNHDNEQIPESLMFWFGKLEIELFRKQK